MICQAIKKNGKLCGREYKTEGKFKGRCNIVGHHAQRVAMEINDKKIVTSDSDVTVITINTTDQSSTDTIMCESQVNTEIKCATSACSSVATSGQYCSPCKYMRDESIPKVVVPVSAPKEVTPIIKKIKVITAMLRDDTELTVNLAFIKEVIDIKAYDRPICKLLCIFNRLWFNSNDNLFHLAGMFYNFTAGNQIGFQSYLVAIYGQFGDNMGIDSIVSTWNAWYNKPFHSKFNLTKLKAIAGGTNPEKFQKWKDTYEPAPIEIKAEKKSRKSKTDSDVPSDVPFVPPTQNGIPAIFDKNNPCSFNKDSTPLAERPVISWEEANEFVYNNIAFIANGALSFYMTKTFDLDGNLSYTQVSIGKMDKCPIRFNLPDNEGNVRPIPIKGVIIKINAHITYEHVGFIPYSKASDYNFNDRSVFNIFTGFIHSYDESFQIDHDKIVRFLDHMKMIWCDGNEQLFAATLKWFAHLIQNPQTKTQVCLVVLGREGTGKNILLDIIRNYIMGLKYVAETCKMDKLTGRFNSLQENKLLVVLNEAANVGQAESHDNQERLKDMITNTTCQIERKGVDTYTIADRCNYVCFSNNDYVIKASTEMRRFVFFETSSARIGDHQYFKDLLTDFQQHDGGIHLYHYLMSIDISDFTPQRDFPTTQLKEQLKADALEKPIQWLVASVNEELEYHHNIVEGFNSVGKMRDNFNMWLDSQGNKSSWTATRFGRSMTQVLGTTKQVRLNKVQTRGYDLNSSELKAKLINYTRRSDLFN